MKAIVFGYSEFACIGVEELLRAGYDIAAVFTYPDDPVESAYYRSLPRLCIEHGIPAYTIDSSNEKQRYALIESIAPDFIFSFYYRSLIPDAILKLAKRGAYNIHGSLLPQFRGRAPVNWTLVHGATTTGVTLHHMVSRADAGDIVAQVEVPVAYEDTAYLLQRKLLAAAKPLFAHYLPMIANGTAPRIPQDISQGMYCGRRRPEDGQINWTQPAETVRNLIRAVTIPYPGAFTPVGERKLLIWEARVDMSVKAMPGTIVFVSPLTIACADGAIVVISGQMGSSIVLSGTQLASEYGLEVGMNVAPCRNAA